MHNHYRNRIYSNYVNARNTALTSKTLEDLITCGPYLERMIRHHFPANRSATIIDLGCGQGAIIHFARLAGYTNLRGVDGSGEQIEAAKRLGIDGVEHGDLLEILTTLPNASQDCIVTFDVIEHFTKDELITIVDGIRRVLKLGGRWIIHAPNGESPFAGRIFFGDFTHELAFTRTSIAQLLYSSGFSDVRSYEDEPIPHGVNSLIRWTLWKCIRGGLRLFLAVETGDSGREAIFSQNFLTVALK